MLIFPAIDLKQARDGRCLCVRLRQGRADAETVFSDDPPAVAKRWEDAGAEWLHVVDLDGAFTGRPTNAAAIAAIVQAVTAKIQTGGGIRDDAAAERLLGLGVQRVVIGTRGLTDAAWLRALCARYPDRIAGAIDARGGRVAVDGWTRDSGIDALEAARTFAGCGVAAVVFTDIATDGMMLGPNVAATERLLEAVAVPVIASGGVSTVEDVRRLAALPLEGIIIGRALYDGTVDLGEAIRLAGQASGTCSS